VDDARAGKGAGLWTGGLPAGGTFSENQAGRWQQRFPTSLEPNWALWVCERQWPEGKRAQGGKAMGDLKADMERGRGLRAEGSGATGGAGGEAAGGFRGLRGSEALGERAAQVYGARWGAEGGSRGEGGGEGKEGKVGGRPPGKAGGKAARPREDFCPLENLAWAEGCWESRVRPAGARGGLPPAWKDRPAGWGHEGSHWGYPAGGERVGFAGAWSWVRPAGIGGPGGRAGTGSCARGPCPATCAQGGGGAEAQEGDPPPLGQLLLAQGAPRQAPLLIPTRLRAWRPCPCGGSRPGWSLPLGLNEL
jgi:hypothetical protein